MIANDSSLLLYIELKTTDHSLAAYALRVEFEKLLNHSPFECDLHLDSSYLPVADELEHKQMSDDLRQPTFTVTMIYDFALSVQISSSLTDETCFDAP
ncbi:Hypothetical predicted protein, partial [Olea europaea subsp. europaea]